MGPIAGQSCRRRRAHGREMPVGVSSDRELKAEGRPASGVGLDPDPPMIPVHNSPTDGHPYAGSRISVAVMQPREKPKDVLPVLRVDADAVVTHGKRPMPILPFRRYMHNGWPSRAAVFYCIADE